ncbi:MAG: serine/threonine-protein phosphatase [Chloroflexi bacterium]|nr:serine/threonine-protein phosphatase [Chloroflexota bacterium]
MTDRPGEYVNAATDGPRIDVGQLSVVGRVRTGNEDSVLCEPPESALASSKGLFCAVADGMGGHAAGEEASRLAVQVAHRLFYETNGMDPMEALRLAVVQANSEVFEAGAGATGRDHMGSTLTAAVLFEHRVVVGHVGDSRAYIVHGDTIRPLTRDHSWVAEEVEAGRMTREQARVSPRRNIITRALGLRPDVQVDSYEAELTPGDFVVICSDGLHGLVSDDEILAYVQRLRPADSVASLVNLANNRGGPDNISLVVARVRDHERDETDTARGIPALNDASFETVRAERPDLAPTNQLPASVAYDPSMSEMPTAPGLPVPPPPTTPYPPAAVPADAPTAPSPMPARPTPQQLAPLPSEPRARRNGGLTLLIVLLLLLVAGAAIGFGLAYMANIPLLPGSS